MIDKFGGGPVGLDTLAAAICEESGTIEDVIEPFLIQQGFINRTPRGRVATRAAYLHFGRLRRKCRKGRFSDMQLVFDFPIKPQYTLGDFVKCCGNEAFLAFAGRLLSADAGENLLYLHGEAGSGKTHLLSAIGGELSASSQVAIPVIPVGQLHPETCEASFALLRSLPALLLDDLHLLADDSALRSALWQLFNNFMNQGARLPPPPPCRQSCPHWTSTCNPASCGDLWPDSTSRTTTPEG